MAVVELTDQDFKNHVTDHGKTIVKYHAGWCGSCRLFAPKFKRLSNDERFDGISFVDVNAEHNPETRKLAGVTNLPYFAIFKDGELIDGVATNKEDAVVDLIGRLN
ncbi:MAG: thioredoxin family protein [Bacteroidota bacterium]